jgi:hypothetical protein
MRLSFLGVICLLALGQAAVAQVPQNVKGRVAAIKGDTVTVTTASGDVTVVLAPDWSISVSAPIAIGQIKPGSFIGTTNVNVPGGGRSTEIHVFPPGAKAFAGQRMLDAGSGSMMTNGTVGKVVASANGRELDISFPGGMRHVMVPPIALITSVTPVDRAQFKPGIVVSIAVFTEPGQPLLGRFVSTGPGGSAPAR